MLKFFLFFTMSLSISIHANEIDNSFLNAPSWTWFAFVILLLGIILIFTLSMRTRKPKENTILHKKNKKKNEVIIANHNLIDTTEALIKLLMLKSNKTKIKNKDFNFKNLIYEVEGGVNKDFTYNNIEIIFNIDDTISKFLIGDSQSIESALRILVKNTITHTPHTKVTLSIKRLDLDIIQFKVYDGKFNTKVNSKDIFLTEEYNKAIDRHTRAELFLAKELIELMGGTLTIHNTIDRGSITTFEIQLLAGKSTYKQTINYGVDEDIIDNTPIIEEKKPIAKEKALVHRSTIEKEKDIVMNSFLNFGKMKLLIVEDNAINQRLLTSILGKSAIDITIAENGQEAVIAVLNNEKEFDIILMDINMPIMDGYEATEKIRASSKFNTLPIVALTALGQAEQIDKMFDSGINAYLGKPLDVGRLYTAFKIFYGVDSGIDMDNIKKPRYADIDGLDIKKGIDNATGNEELYRKLLNEFVVTYSEIDELLESLAEQKRYDEMKIVCEDMKVILNTIGAYNLNKALGTISTKIEDNGKYFTSDYIDDYKKEASKLKYAIGEYL